MPPILHLLRHGQGHHATSSNQIRDAELTDKGREQARARCEAFPNHEKIGLLLASPLRRTLQTCSLVFAPCLEKGMVITAFPLGEEASANPCDTGLPLSELKPLFPKDSFDFSLLETPEWGEEWYMHTGARAVTHPQLSSRAIRLRQWIKDRPEAEVALVAHGFFNHYISGEVDGEGNQTTGWWREAECRTYEFVDGDEGAGVRETKGSVERRRGEEEAEKRAEEGQN